VGLELEKVHKSNTKRKKVSSSHTVGLEQKNQEVLQRLLTQSSSHTVGLELYELCIFLPSITKSSSHTVGLEPVGLSEAFQKTLLVIIPHGGLGTG